MADWTKLLNPKRQDSIFNGAPSVGSATADERTEIEKDHDRILFSTPVRRLADKTQVFPLEKNDSVRNRLTHSHEVANLARSLGTSLAFKSDVAKDVAGRERNLPSLLAAVGLAHDLGNPPFGHQGEKAIQSWFRDKSCEKGAFDDLNERQRKDFLLFEGNAQTFRLVTRLQPGDRRCGLNLTYASLAALMKYPTFSDAIDNSDVARKKHGVFASEQDTASRVWEQTGLAAGRRHPLTYLMEACDDIAYTMLDAEDAVKKKLVSFWDLVFFLESHGGDDEATGYVTGEGKRKHADYRKESLSPAELNDVATQRFRVFVIGRMVADVRNAFLAQRDSIEAGELREGLVEVSGSKVLSKLLRKFDADHAYTHRSVREIELQGFNTIRTLMDFLWEAVSSWKRSSKPHISEPFAAYVYSRISENYRRVFEDSESVLPERYRQFQLVADMISGMTDSFALSLHDEIAKYKLR